MTIVGAGVTTRAIGIYSGRLTRTPENTNDETEEGGQLDAQLGLVWPLHLVEEIVAGRHRDSH
jgi:hypothetical protein